PPRQLPISPAPTTRVCTFRGCVRASKSVSMGRLTFSRFYKIPRMRDCSRFATFKCPSCITENREETSGQEKEGQEKEEIGTCPANPGGDSPFRDSPRCTLFPFFIPFHFSTESICEFQGFGIPVLRRTLDDF